MIINNLFPSEIIFQTENIIKKCLDKKIKIGFAESCTGGLLSTLFTEISGSSMVLESSLVTYSNQAKIDFLQVSKKSLEKFGAVSQEVAKEMARGILQNCHVDLALGITGIAGPNGGSPQKPVGTVFISLATFEKDIVKQFCFLGDRSQIRFQAVIQALEIIEENL
jgi:nicotinamide-nucleotide amidase